jgi:hypothetical protein
MKEKMTSGEIAKQADVEFEELLSENFDRVDKIALPGPLVFDRAEALFDRAAKKYPEGGKYLEDNRNLLENYFVTVLLKDGHVTIDMDTVFYHCFR